MGRRARSTHQIVDPYHAADICEKLAALEAAGYLSRRDAEVLRQGLDAIVVEVTERDHERLRNFWVALDFRAHRGIRNREKIVATRWGLNARQVAKIGSRHQAEAASRMDGGPHSDAEWRVIIGRIAKVHVPQAVSPARTD